MDWDQINSQSDIVESLRRIAYNLAHLLGRYIANLATLRIVLQNILIAFLQGVFSNSEFYKNSAQQLGLSVQTPNLGRIS